MALEPAGVILQAQGAQAYLATLERINKAQQQAFNPASLKDYQDAASRLRDVYKDLPKNIPKQIPLPKPDEANKLKEALDTLGRTGKYSIQQVSEETRRLNEALQTVRKSGQFTLDIKQPIKSDKLGELTNRLDQTMGNPFKGLVGDVNELTGAVAGLVGKFTLVAGVLKIAHDLFSFGQTAIAVAQRNETLAVSLQEVGTQAGYSQDQIKLATQLLTKQGITTQASQQSLLRMARANISWAEASKLAAIAQGSAVVAGINSSDAFERLVTGIQKQEPELLDELGITLRREKAYEAMAAQLGVSTKQLTDAQKQQAILNSIYEQSESVLGVYDAAMDTSGKQQASLARYIEETQNNLGKMLLPLTETKVEMETGFWKAMQKITLGLQALAPLLSDVLPDAFGPLKDAFASLLGIDENFDFIDRLGEGIYNFSRLAVAGFAATRAAGQTAVKQLMDYWNSLFDMMSKGFSGDFTGAANAFKASVTTLSDTGDEFVANFQNNMGRILEEYPDLTKSWGDITKGVAGDSEDLRLAQEGVAAAVADASEAIEGQIEALEATKDAYNKIKDIQENFQSAQQQAKEDYEKGLADAEEKYLKERERKIAEFNKKLAEFDAESARKRAKMIDEFEIAQANRLREFNLQQSQAQQQYDLKVVQDKRKFYDDQKRQLRDFQLNQRQELRRFNIEDRRLRADGDVLALMEARENFELEKKEKKENFDNAKVDATEAYEEQRRQARENFDLQQQMARDSFALQTEMQREEFQRRLQEFDENTALQREKMIEAHALELEELAIKFEEEKVKLKEQYDERMAMAQEQRDKQLAALGDSLKAEGELTEEGMKEIAAKISELFGDDAAGDQLIKGWSERSENEINNMVDAIAAKIEELKGQLKSGSEAINETLSNVGSSSSSPDPGTSGGRWGRGGQGSGGTPTTTSSIQMGTRRIGARQGFNGFVTGPKTFQVEPGMREHVAITPANSIRGNIVVSGRTQHDITGASPQASDMMAQQIAATLVSEIRVAVKKLSRRVGS